MTNKILVLEDSIDRVNWLREEFPKLDVIHATNPLEFVKGWDESPSLIILDHDLGLSDWDGYKACQLLSSLDEFRVTPILIWSLNPAGVANMQMFLAHEGFRVRCFMFGLSFSNIKLEVLRATKS